MTLADLLALAEKATPGPWSASCRHVDGPKDGDLIAISSWPKEEWLQCELRGPDCNVGRGDMIGPDAAYIAACSPELVAALVRCVMAQDVLMDSDNFSNLHDVAIARAELDRLLGERK